MRTKDLQHQKPRKNNKIILMFTVSKDGDFVDMEE